MIPDTVKAESYQSYLRGFKDGVAVTAMKPTFTRHPKGHIKREYEQGYADGRMACQEAMEKAGARIGYTPSILRIQWKVAE